MSMQFIFYSLHVINRGMIFFIMAMLLGCQTAAPTVVDKKIWGELDPAEQLDLTFVNQFDTVHGSPNYRILGEEFLKAVNEELATQGIQVSTLYTFTGGFIKGRYRLVFGPVVTYNRRPGESCFRADLYDRKHEDGSKAIWSAWIWAPPLDSEGKTSPTRGFGMKTGRFLANELISQLQEIGLIKTKNVSSIGFGEYVFSMQFGANALRRPT